MGTWCRSAHRRTHLDTHGLDEGRRRRRSRNLRRLHSHHQGPPVVHDPAPLIEVLDEGEDNIYVDASDVPASAERLKSWLDDWIAANVSG